MSIELRRVVIATDFSGRSLHAARWTVLHLVPDAEVVLVHVVAIPELPHFISNRFPQIATVTESAVAGATKRLDEFATTLRGSRVRTEVRVGGTAEKIAEVAREVTADLIVVGRHGDRPGVTHRIGTTADRIVRIAHIPVLLATSMRDARPRHILAALDDADITPGVVEWSRYLATHFGASLTGLHVVASATLSYLTMHACADAGTTGLVPSSMRDDVARVGATWVQSVMGAGSPTPSLDSEIVFGWVAHEIIGAAERRNSDLIVIGRTGRGLGQRMLLGSVTRQVLRTALCPVLVVTGPEATSVARAPAA